jgi:hypothetical protein
LNTFLSVAQIIEHPMLVNTRARRRVIETRAQARRALLDVNGAGNSARPIAPFKFNIS